MTLSIGDTIMLLEQDEYNWEKEYLVNGVGKVTHLEDGDIDFWVTCPKTKQEACLGLYDEYVRWVVLNKAKENTPVEVSEVEHTFKVGDKAVIVSKFIKTTDDNCLFDDGDLTIGEVVTVCNGSDYEEYAYEITTHYEDGSEKDWWNVEAGMLKPYVETVQDDEGWIENTGVCPVDEDEHVDVRFKDGSGEDDDGGIADSWGWEDKALVKWRLHKPNADVETVSKALEQGEDTIKPPKFESLSEASVCQGNSVTAASLLQRAAELQEERGLQYDKGQERSAAKVAQVFNTITGKDLTEEDVWMLLVVLKQVRYYSNVSAKHRDSVEDLISYAALFGESVLKEN